MIEIPLTICLFILGIIVAWYIYHKQKYENVFEKIINDANNVLTLFANKKEVKCAVSDWLNSCAQFKRKYEKKLSPNLNSELSGLSADFKEMANIPKNQTAIINKLIFSAEHYIRALKNYQ